MMALQLRDVVINECLSTGPGTPVSSVRVGKSTTELLSDANLLLNISKSQRSEGKAKTTVIWERT